MTVEECWYFEYVGRPKQGSKDPIFIDCDFRKQEPALRGEVLVKPSSHGAQQAREFIGNLLARSFGLQTPKPVVVHLTEDDLASLARHYERERRFLPDVLPELAGVLKMPLGTNVPLSTVLEPDLYESALRLFVFDMLTHYADRTESNPNCSWSASGLLVFDFEQCCPTDPRIMQPGPVWTPCARGLAPFHFLYRHLNGRSPNLGFIPEAMTRLIDLDWRILVDRLPTTWQEESSRILDHVHVIAEHLTEFTADIQAGLR